MGPRGSTPHIWAPGLMHVTFIRLRG